MDLATAISKTSLVNTSWQLWLATCASGFVFNLIHAGATGVFLLLLYKPLLSKLARVKEKYGLLE